MKKRKEEIIIGFHSVIEAIDAGKTIEKVFIKKGLRGDLFHECFKLIRREDIPFQYVPIEKLNRITQANHQGVIAVVSAISYQDISMILPGIFEAGKDPFILVLDGVTDIRNFGAIARSAESAGVDAIIIGTKNSATINSDAIKTSAGALNRIPVCRVNSLSETLQFLQQSGLKLYGASEKTSDFYYDCNFEGPVGIVMGAEDKGLSSETIKRVDSLIKIPMMGNISSLNVSVACGVILYEVVRQKSV